jgi:hypothetical protein
MGWTSILPPDLVARAYRYKNEIAWTKEDALTVVAAIERQGWSVLGIDAWKATTPGPTPLCDDWSDYGIGRFPGYPETPSEFIRRFPWQSFSPGYPGIDVHFAIGLEDRDP